MDTTIICPHCGQSVEVTEAFKTQLEASILNKEREAYQKQLRETQEEAVKELQKKETELEKMRSVELSLRKEKNQLEEAKRNFELEKQRQIDRERDNIRQKTLEEAQEAYHLKEKEWLQKLESTQKSLEDAQRKAHQGSQQMQGEVQELDLEELFRREFIQDIIEPVGKGVLGADIRQTVKSPLGVICGTILWESKRTKAWSDSWITKLKNDLLADRANIPAIISEVVPDEAKSGIGLKDGVWITTPKLAVALAMLLRSRLLDVAKQKKIALNQQSKAEDLYDYVTSHDFQNQVEAMIEIYQEMQRQIQKERIAFEKSWKLREAQVGRLLSGVAGIYGSMQGIAGAALPSIKTLELGEEQEKLIE